MTRKNKNKNNSKSTNGSETKAVENELNAKKRKIEDSSSGNDTTMIEMNLQMEKLEGKVFENDILLEKYDQRIKLLEESNAILTRLLEEERYKTQILSYNVNDNSQYSRRNSVRIYNLTDKDPNEDVQQTEKLVRDFLRSKLGLSFGAQDFDICHRLGNFSPTSNRVVIVKFIHRKSKIVTIANRRKLKGSNITIAEDLTPKNARRLYEIRHLSCVSQSWSRDGRLFAKNQNNFIKEIKPEDSISEALFDKRPAVESSAHPPPMKEAQVQKLPTQQDGEGSSSSTSHSESATSENDKPSDMHLGDPNVNSSNSNSGNDGNKIDNVKQSKGGNNNSRSNGNHNDNNIDKVKKSAGREQNKNDTSINNKHSSSQLPSGGDAPATDPLPSIGDEAMETNAISNPKPLRSSTPKQKSITEKLINTAQGK